MSRTLARLREALGDELLVRSAGAMVLTERAERLRPLSARRVVLLEDRLVVLGRAGHPVLASARVDLDDYCRAQHGIVRLSADGPTEGVVDQVLAQRGRGRRIVAELSTFASVPGVAASTDILFAFSEHLAKAASHHLPVTWRPLPVPLSGFPVAAAWHERSQNDDGHRWLRSGLVDGARSG